MQPRRTLQPLPPPPQGPAGVAPATTAPTGAGSVDIPRVVADELANVRTYDRCTTIVSQGSSGGKIFVVREGLLREAAVSSDGRWFVHALLGPGEVFGTVGPSTPSPAAVRTVRRTALAALEGERLAALLASRPDAAQWLIGAIERRTVRAQRIAQDLAWFDVGARLRRRLLALARDHGRRVASGVQLEIPLTQEDLGAMIGATRETVNRALVGLIASGRVRVDRRRYVVLDALLTSPLGDEPVAP